MTELHHCKKCSEETKEEVYHSSDKHKEFWYEND